MDQSRRDSGTFSRSDFSFDKVPDVYTCTADKMLTTTASISTRLIARYPSVCVRVSSSVE
jgi:hypothetical protein